MTLLDLKGYLSYRGQASVAEISVHFGSSPEVVRDMVDRWRSRDCIRLVGNCGPCSGSCACSNSAETEVYEWVGRAVNRERNKSAT